MATSTGTAEGVAASYILDAAKSRFQLKAFASGLLAGFGHNPNIAIRDFNGEARFNTQAPDQSSLKFIINAASLVITGDPNEKDRAEMERAMREDVLEITRFPEITFVSSSAQANRITEGMFRMKITGKLTLHGVTRDLDLLCNVTVSDETLRANGDFIIKQTDYRIKLVSVAGGALKLKDELKFTYDIAGRRSNDAGDAKIA